MNASLAGNLAQEPVGSGSPSAPKTREQLLCELARDGAWTARQLDARLAASGRPPIDAYLTRAAESLRPTAWARRRRTVEVVRLNARGAAVAASHGVPTQLIRAGELEHALGLAELRWRCGVPYDRYAAQDVLGRTHRQGLARSGLGFGHHLADGMFSGDSGIVLAEYDHGRYTAKQIRMKLAAFREVRRVQDQLVVGAVWGAPTARRAAWLQSIGVGHVVVMEPDTWLV
jgi:hypothetical protein